MPALLPSDLAEVRSPRPGRRWTLYVYQPETNWTGTVGGTPTQGDTELTVATVTGNPLNILADATVWVRSSTGAVKMWPSKVRFKSYSAPTMTVAENAIDWAAGDVLTAVRLFEIWPRIPYITSDGVQWKDKDIAWASDAQAQPPKANAGPAAIASLVGGQADLVFQNTNSFSCPGGGGVSSYLWTDHGGAPAVVAGAVNTSTVTYRYTIPGYYYVRLQVTDANGRTGVRYIPVIIDDGSLGQKFVVPGDRRWDNNGWVLDRDTITLLSENHDADWYDGAPLFLVGTPNTQVAPTAFAFNRYNLRWSGWLIEDTADRDYHDRRVRFSAVSSAHVLGNVPAFPVGLRSDATPADWYEYTQLSIDSVAYLLLRWHSTICEVADYYPTGEWTTRLRPGENCRAEDLLSQVNAVLAACKGDLRCDRQGLLRAIRHEWYLSAAEEAARATVMTLTNQDFRRAQYGPDQHRAQVREVRASGVDGSDNPYIAGSPGRSPLDGGRPLEVQRLAPLNQAELNQWAGQQLALENHKAVVRLQMSGEYDCGDPAKGEYFTGSLNNFDPRIPNGPYSIVGVRFRDDHALGYTLAEWELLPRPGMHQADAIEIPIETEPPEPEPEPLPDPDPIIRGTGEVVIIGTRGAGVCYTLDCISGVPPTWYQLNDVLDGSVVTTLDDTFIDALVLNPVAPSFQAACIDGAGEVFVNNNWRGLDYWYPVLTEAEAISLHPSAPGSVTLTDLTVGPDGTLGVVADYLSGLTHDTALLYSTNWADPSQPLGSRWTYLDLPDGWSGSYTQGSFPNYQCTYNPHGGWRFYPKSNPQLGWGQIHLYENGGVLCAMVLAMCAGHFSDGRANIAHHNNVKGYGAWSVAYTVPTANQAICGTGNGALGGRQTASYQYTGPLASCYNVDDQAFYAASFKQHANTGSNHALARIQYGLSIQCSQTWINTDITYGWGARPGMLFAPPLLSGHEFIALYPRREDPLDPTTYVTDIHVNTATESSPDKTIPQSWRAGYCFPNLVDEGEFAITYLGRSYDTGAGERADADNQEVFKVCKRRPGAIVSSFDDKTGNLWSDFAAEGVTAIQADTESD